MKLALLEKRLEALLSVLQVFVCRSQGINGTNRPASIKARSHRAKANVKVKKIKEQSDEIKVTISNIKENFHFRVLLRCEWTLKALFTHNVYVGANGNVSIQQSTYGDVNAHVKNGRYPFSAYEFPLPWHRCYVKN